MRDIMTEVRVRNRARYSSFDDAMAAARKLARENDAQFHVLKTVATARPGNATQEALL